MAIFVKKKFSLLKDVPNVLNIPSRSLSAIAVPRGNIHTKSILKVIEGRINHFTKKSVFNFLDDPQNIKKISVIKTDTYPLHISYNKPTGSIVLNLTPFGAEDLSSINSRALYSAFAYGLGFSRLVSGKAQVSEIYASPIINYLMSVFVRIFGKEYGLMTTNIEGIAKLKFVIAVYILSSFFGIPQKNTYKKASAISGFDHRVLEDKMNAFDFNDIEHFIISLSSLHVMPGLNKHRFAEKIYRFLGINFIPALEDLSRFISTIVAADMVGANFIPSFIKKAYNEREFEKITSLSKSIFI